MTLRGRDPGSGGRRGVLEEKIGRVQQVAEKVVGVKGEGKRDKGEAFVSLGIRECFLLPSPFCLLPSAFSLLPSPGRGVSQPPELRVVQQRDAVTAFAQPLDFQQLAAPIAPGRL